MSTALKAVIRLMVPAGAAKPSPAIGQALGSVGVNMMQFCKEFNDKTKHFVKEIPIRVNLAARHDKSFSFDVQPPPTSWLVKKAAGLQVAAHTPGRETVGRIHVKQVYEIARIRKQDNPKLEWVPLESVAKSVVASCRSMGIKVLDTRTTS
jgi:large subunit ribosomal protein L11